MMDSAPLQPGVRISRTPVSLGHGFRCQWQRCQWPLTAYGRPYASRAMPVIASSRLRPCKESWPLDQPVKEASPVTQAVRSSGNVQVTAPA